MANTLKFGGGTWATKEGSTLAYNDENDRYKPLPFTTTRDSIATRVNKEGLIEVVGNDVPRIDYTDSADGVLLLENSSTNYSPHSEIPSIWTYTEFGSGSSGTITTGKTDMFGGTNAVQVDFPSNADNVGILFGTASSGLSSGDCTISIYVKLVESGNKNLQLRAGFKGIVNVNSTEFTRVDLSGTKTNSEAFNLKLRPSEGTSTGGFSIIICHPQEENNSYPTSYIPTNGSTVTRAADTASGAGNSEVFNDSEGVLFANISTDSEDTYKYLSINNGTPTGNQTRVALGYYGSTLYPNVRVSNVHQFNEAFSVNPTLNNKIALKYKTNDFALWVNGFEVLESNSGSTFSDGTLSKFDFDDGASSSDFYGKTKEIGYYDTALTDEELEYMTSYRTLRRMAEELNLNKL